MANTINEVAMTATHSATEQGPTTTPLTEGTERTSTENFAVTNASASSSLTPPLPELPYSLRDHKRNIFIIWTLLALDAAIMPLVLFYPLWYASDLKPAYIFAVTTGLFGIISGIEWAYRSWRLWREEFVRPIGGKRNGFDFFHISYTTGYCIALLELIVGAAPHHPFVRLCAMPAPSFIIFFGGELLLFTILGVLGCKTPFQMSSLPKGVPIRPVTYTILEDVIAVDTGKGRDYREALNARWEASPRFRRLLKKVDILWSVPALVVGFACTAVIAIPQINQNIGYGIGWGVPPLWAGLWVVLTTYSVQYELKKEWDEWYKDGGAQA